MNKRQANYYFGGIVMSKITIKDTELELDIYDADENGSANVVSKFNFAVSVGDEWKLDIRQDYINAYEALNMGGHDIDLCGNHGAIIRGYTNSVLQLAAGAWVAMTIGGDDIVTIDANGLNLHGHAITGQSDRRLKRHIKFPTADPLATIKDMQFVQYDWRDSGRHVDVGIIAQQLEQIAPELVVSDKDDYKNINYTQLLQRNRHKRAVGQNGRCHIDA